MNLQIWALSDVGKVRRSNEDSFYVSAEDNLLIVCDGMGGQVAGSLASKLAVESIKDFYAASLDHRLLEIVEDADPKLPEHATRLILSVRMANRRLYEMARRHPHLRGMGTTVAAMAFSGGIVAMVHVGDSRIYRLRRGRLSQLTSDHSWLQELLDDEEIAQEDIGQFAKKNVITRALGVTPTVRLDLRYERAKEGDCYMLCSDGLHGALGYSELVDILQDHANDFERTAHTLLERAKAADGSDNITLALGKVQNVGTEAVPNFSLFTTVAEEPAKLVRKESRFLRQRYREPRRTAFVPLRRFVPKDRLSIAATIVCTLAAVLVLLVVKTYVTGSQSEPLSAAGAKDGFFTRLKERTLALGGLAQKSTTATATEKPDVTLPAQQIDAPPQAEAPEEYLLLLYAPSLEAAGSLHLPDSVVLVGEPVRLGSRPERASTATITLTDQENKVMSRVRTALPMPGKP